jgi:hypothetical protein
MLSSLVESKSVNHGGSLLESDCYCHALNRQLVGKVWKNFDGNTEGEIELMGDCCDVSEEINQKGGGSMPAACSCCSMTSSGAFSMDMARPILELLYNRS